MTLQEMVNDFCRRAKTHYTPDQVMGYGLKNIPFYDEDGFFILSVSDCSELRIDYFYIVPGSPRRVFRRYAAMIQEAARAHGCRYVQSVALRDKGFDRLYATMLPGMKPIGTFYQCDLEVEPYVEVKQSDQ